MIPGSLDHRLQFVIVGRTVCPLFCQHIFSTSKGDFHLINGGGEAGQGQQLRAACACAQSPWMTWPVFSALQTADIHRPFSTTLFCAFYNFQLVLLSKKKKKKKTLSSAVLTINFQ